MSKAESYTEPVLIISDNNMGRVTCRVNLAQVNHIPIHFLEILIFSNFYLFNKLLIKTIYSNYSLYAIEVMSNSNVYGLIFG